MSRFGWPVSPAGCLSFGVLLGVLCGLALGLGLQGLGVLRVDRRHSAARPRPRTRPREVEDDAA
jgi:hypothetical protein